MKITLLENTHPKNNITEIFGLAKAGKTYFLKNQLKKGKHGVLVEDLPLLKKLWSFIKLTLKHPIKTSYLFYKTNSNWVKHPDINAGDYMKIFIMRNSYLAASLAKYQILRKNKKQTLVDEFSLQSLFMIFQEKAPEEELRKTINILPKSKQVLIIEESKKIRDQRMAARKKPSRNLNPIYFKLWRQNLEHNYKIIKKLVLEHYTKSHKSL